MNPADEYQLVYCISLWSGRKGPVYGPDGYETNFCGSWSVPCADDDPAAARLDGTRFGRCVSPDGVVERAFFFQDELADQLARAERETGCFATYRTLRMRPSREGVAA